jgi:2',3'-cyclic-nucleotide 2'-phosphodiesterase (5'-nucleotidase family)
MTQGKATQVSHRLIPVEETIPEDPEMAALVNTAMAPHREKLNEIIGQTATALNRNTILEATMDNLLLAALAEVAGVSVAYSNGWRYGAPIPPGPITRQDIWNMVPPNPPVSLVELTGAEMCAMMEENLERTFACDAYAQMGGYVKRCHGVTVTVKLENPHGSRIQRFFVGADLLDPEATYMAAFITNQGVPAQYGRNRRDLPIRAVDALESYLAGHSPVQAELSGKMVAV